MTTSIEKPEQNCLLRPEKDALAQVQKLDRDGLIRPYNLLSDENLYRAVLYDTAEEGKYLFLDFHHILIDEADGLYLKLDTSQDFTPGEIDRMAERMDQLMAKLQGASKNACRRLARGFLEAPCRFLFRGLVPGLLSPEILLQVAQGAPLGLQRL